MVAAPYPYVVRADEFNDGIGQTVLLRQRDPVEDVADDGARTLVVGEVLVGVVRRRILRGGASSRYRGRAPLYG